MWFIYVSTWSVYVSLRHPSPFPTAFFRILKAGLQNCTIRTPNPDSSVVGASSNLRIEVYEKESRKREAGYTRWKWPSLSLPLPSRAPVVELLDGLRGVCQRHRIERGSRRSIRTQAISHKGLWPVSYRMNSFASWHR